MSPESVPLRYVTSVLARGTAPDYVDDGPVRMVSQAANQDAGLDWERTRFHSFTGDSRKLRGYLQSGDSLVNSTGTGTLGRVGWFEKSPDERPCVADGHVTVVRFDPAHVEKRFGFYYLKSNAFQELMFETLVNGSTNQIELSRERMRAVLMPVPPLEEQRPIAEFLDAVTARIDKLTELRERMNSLLGQRRERIIDQEIGAVGGATSDFAPLRYLIDRVGVGIVITPAAWYVDPPGVPALRGVNIRPGEIDDSNLVHISQEGNALHRKSQLDAGDVVAVRTGQAGTAAVVPPELAESNCIDLVIIKPSARTVPRYLEYVLNSDYAKNFVVENSVGTIQSHFNVSAMKRVQIPSISVVDQQGSVRRLDERIGAIDRLRARVDRQRVLLSERRQALITAAVTGEFDVSAASGRGIEE